jgi:hypothetical protein
LIYAKAKTEKGSNIVIPYTSGVDISDANFITFVNRTPVIEENRRALRRRERREQEETTLNLVIDAEITPEALVVFNMNIPPTVGSINAHGAGNLKINIDNMERISMLGTVTLQEGFYDFDMLQSVIHKRFNFDAGGTISWSGDVVDNANINLTGVYNTKANLSPVLANNVASIDVIPRGKVNVQSLIKLTGKLNQPVIEFDFRLPGVDEDLRNQFLNLVQKDQNEFTKQTFSLLLLNTFAPIGSSSSFATANSAFSFTTESLSNQLNNFLSKLDLKIGNFELPQVGLNFRPEDENYSSQVDINLSTQFFDNRLIIDGNLGYGGTSKTQDPTGGGRTSQFLGEFNAEYRITNNLSAKIFNRPNEKNTVGDYSQGLGIGYKIDFDAKAKDEEKTEKSKKTKKTKGKKNPENSEKKQ